MENKKKIILLFSIITVLFTSFIFYIESSNVKENKNFVKEILTKEAKGYFENIVSTRHWNSGYGGVYVKAKDNLKANEYLEDNHIYAENGELLIKINPAWMTRQISEISNKSNKNYFKITSLNPLNPQNIADEFETRALKYFEKNKSERFYTETSEDLSKFNFMGSLKVEKSCLQCHAKQGYKEGDIRGGIRISIPTEGYLDKLVQIIEKYDYLMIISLIGGLLTLITFIVFINKVFTKQEIIEKNYKDIKRLKRLNDEYLSRYQYAIDGTTDGIWDWDLITNKVYFSKNWKKMLGYEDDEMQNSLDEWKKRIHPEDEEQAIKDILDNQNKVTEYYQNTHRLRHKDGSWVWILDRGRTYFDKNGKAVRMVGFHSNLTELKNLELSLADTKQELSQLKLVIDNAEIGIVITNIDAEITYVNPFFSKVSGYSKAELIGNNPRILKFEEDKDDEKFIDLWNTIVQKKSWGGIFRNRKKDGSEYWETATILPILDENHEISNYLGIMREITKEIYLEKQLKEKEELMLLQSKSAAMGEMISMIAHQWRQPITTISMNANNIIADIELESFDEKIIKVIAEDISAQTQFLSNTIDDFRNFFKTDKEINDFKIKSLFDELSIIILASLKNNNIEFSISCDEKIRLKSYKRELLQVLLNIVKNAKEAFSSLDSHNENKKIWVEVEELGKKVKITINDNAGGIPEDILDKIFEPYFTTKEEFNGTGLGLYMSKIIVEQHLTGLLKVSNTQQGAEFTILLHDLEN